MRNSIIIAFFLLIIPLLSPAQEDSILLSKNFEFNDGIYMDFESFQKNTPTYSWKEVKTNLISNPQTFMAQMEYLSLINGDRTIDMNEIWGISISGLPYIRLEKGAVKKPMTTFAALKIRGKICYFQFEDFKQVEIPMPVYNPLTGKPYRVSNITRNVEVYYEYIMDFETGEIIPLTVDNLISWIGDDAQLIKALESFDEEEAWEKLFKCILIYDDRHEVYIKK